MQKSEIMDHLAQALNIVIDDEPYTPDQVLIIKKLVEIMAILERPLMKEVFLDDILRK